MFGSVICDREGKCVWCVLNEQFGCHALAFGGIHVGLLWSNSCCAPCIAPRRPRAHYTLPFIPSKHGVNDKLSGLLYVG